MPYHKGMTTAERIARLELKVHRLAPVRDQVMDLTGISVEGKRRLATRTERLEENFQRLELTVREIGEKLNRLIAVVNGIVRRHQ